MTVLRRSRRPRAGCGRSLRVGALLGAFTAALLAGTIAFAGFNSTSASSGSVSTDRIFPATRSTSAWTVSDASSGSAAVGTSVLAVSGDSRIVTTGAWSSSFSSTRYFDVTFNSPLPGGETVSGATFNFTLEANAGAETACVYFEVYRASTSTLIGTHGSSGSPLVCAAASAYSTINTALSEVTSSDIANDLRIRVYVKESNNQVAKIDLATLTGTHYQQFTLYPISYTDASTGTPATTAWGPATVGDSSTYQSAANWATTISSTRYITFTFPGYLPTNAVINSATLVNVYRPQTAADTACYYFETYASGSLLGTHGSSGATVSCDTGTGYQTDNVSLSEVTTPTQADNLAVKMYYKDSGSKPTQYDQVALQINYSLDSNTTCPSPGSVTLTATADSWADQNNTSQNNGTATTLAVLSQNNKNRRAFVNFSLPATPTECSVTAASLQIYAQTVQGSRTINAYQAAASWTETGVTWANQPATSGSAASTSNSSGYESWNVLTEVTSMLSGSNNGFIIEDSAENGANVGQTYQSRENTNPPKLVLTYG
jgi:hypothetical protein